MDFHLSDLVHDLVPAGHRADAGPPASAVLLPGLDVLGAPPGTLNMFHKGPSDFFA